MYQEKNTTHNNRPSTIFRVVSFSLFLFTFCVSFSQTIFDPPKLNCVRNAGSFIELTWDIPASRPCFDSYEIYYSLNDRNGPYSLLFSVTDPLQTNISINLSLADSAYFYMVQRGTCINPTPPVPSTSDTLDNTKPQPHNELVNVSVIGGQVHVNWVPAKSPEVVAYLIYSDADGFNQADTVFGRLNTSYIDTTANPNNRTYRYKIRSLEYCEDPAGLQGAITPDSVDQGSVLLIISDVNSCTETASVTWQPYKFRNTNVLNYEIQMSVNGSGFSTVGTADATATSFIVPNIPSKSDICLRMQANLPNGAIAYSNERCFTSTTLASIKNDYIRNITVDGNSVIIEYVEDTTASTFRNIILQRSPDGLVFNPLTIAPPTSLNAYTLQLIDGGAIPSEHLYHYSVQINDSCGNRHFSDTAVSLYLNVKEKVGNKADIQWRGFDVQNADFQDFRLEKIVGTDTTLLGTFNRTDNSYLMDNLFDYTVDTLIDICFRITAEFYNLNDEAPQELLFSHSNIVCLSPKPKFFIANAFAPEGVNRTIKPILLLAKRDGYKFTIFDRWHQTVFSTEDIDATWDGTYKGDPAPFDGYLFLCEYTGKDGQTYKQTGTIMLIR